jgi:hypothetical protein
MQFFGEVVVEGIYEPQGFNARVETLKGEFRRGGRVQASEVEMTS